MPNGQSSPKYWEVVTDSSLKTLPTLGLRQRHARCQWLDRKRKECARKVKAQEIVTKLQVRSHLVVMEDR